MPLVTKKGCATQGSLHFFMPQKKILASRVLLTWLSPSLCLCPLGQHVCHQKPFLQAPLLPQGAPRCSTSQLLFVDVVAFESASPLRAAPREPQASKRKIWDSCGVIYHVHLRALFGHVLPFYEHKMCLSSTHTTHVYTMRTYYVYTVHTHTHTLQAKHYHYIHCVYTTLFKQNM